MSDARPATCSWSRSLRALLGVSLEAARSEVARLFALNVGQQLAWLTSMLGIKYLLDAAVDRDVGQAVAGAVLIAGLGYLSSLMGWRQFEGMAIVQEKTARLLDEQLMALTGGIPGIEHYERPEYADHVALVREERRRIASAAYVVALNVRIGLQLAGSVLLLAWMHPLLLLLPLFGLVSFVAQAQGQRLVDGATEATAGASRHRRELFELATSAPAGKELRIFNLAGELLARHHDISACISRQLNDAARQAALLQIAGRLAFALGYLGAIALVLEQALTGRATAGDVGLAIVLAAAINAQVAQAAEELAYLRRIVAIGKHYVWLREYASAAKRPSEDSLPVRETVVDGLELHDVSFRYPGSDRLVLDRVSLKLPAGATVALVGENGSGKTTLVKLLLGMYEPLEGRITLDGTDIARFDVEAWRCRVCSAFQDFCRFEFLLRETVGVGDLHRIEQTPAVVAAIQRAGAEDLPATLAAGLETQLGRAWGGVDLSGGQWQKLAISRALMRPDPLLLIFDEPIAVLDPLSEQLLFERVAAARLSPHNRRYMSLLVSHRFSTVRMADWIVVLQQGRVIEAGTHEELVELGGLYSELYTLQARAYS